LEAMKNKLTESKGEIALNGAVILFVSVLLLMAALEIYHIHTTVIDLRAKTSEAVMAAASSNVSNIYDGVRESDVNSRLYSDSAWIANVDTSLVMSQLQSTTGGTLKGDDVLLKEKSYQLSNLNTVYDNSIGNCLNFTTTGNLEIFVNLGVFNVSIPYHLEVKTTYEKKY
jgi:hypothetical protein